LPPVKIRVFFFHEGAIIVWFGYAHTSCRN
jgi:hypothetical protein